MALGSKCGSCGSTRFETKEVSPSGGGYKQIFVQCSSCGVPAGVVDYFNLGALLKQQESAIQSLDSRLSQIEHKLIQIIQAIQQR